MRFQWYHEQDRGSRNLLMTVGDSWTWGDSLGKTSVRKSQDDHEYRLSHIYGTLASKELDMDHINIGLPGLSNFDMWQRFRRVFNGITKSYDSVTVIFTLTEIGREHAGGFIKSEQDFDAIRGDDWPTWEDIIQKKYDKQKIDFCREEMINHGIDLGHLLDLYLRCQQCQSIDSIMSVSENYVDSLIIDSLEKLKVRWAMGRAFTAWIDTTLVPKRNNLGTWTDLIAQKGNLPSYPKVHVVGQAGLNPLMALCDQLEIPDRQKKWLPYLDLATLAVDWLSMSPYNGNVATRHPLEQAHRWWADHIKEWINDK